MSPQGDPIESAEPAMEARTTYAVDPPTDRSDPEGIPAYLVRKDGTGPVAAMLRERREQAATSCAN